MKTSIYLMALKINFTRIVSVKNPFEPHHFSKSVALRPVINDFKLRCLHAQQYVISDFSEKLLNRPEVQNYLKFISDEYSKYNTPEFKDSPFLSLINDIRKHEDAITNLRTMNDVKDKEMESLIRAEEELYRNEIKRINKELVMYALPGEFDENPDVTLEVHPGLGGQEAKLFAEELMQLYLKYAAFKNWKVLNTDIFQAEGGGIHKGEVFLSGESVYQLLRYEAGVHRVQRIPKTEKIGRAQTSTCKVNVIPDIETDVVLNPKDLKTETKTSSGPGGQNVNKRETCVRVKHIPTGITTECQVHRYQELNREMAIRKLKNILSLNEEMKNREKVKNIKAEQAPTIKRSDKIKTYNFMQNRVTDHRINHTVYALEKYMDGGKVLNDMISLVQANFQEENIIRSLNKVLKEKNAYDLFKGK